MAASSRRTVLKTGKNAWDVCILAMQRFLDVVELKRVAAFPPCVDDSYSILRFIGNIVVVLKRT